jgi:hypothetical protein
MVDMPETKLCVRCREELPLDVFHRNKNKPDGFAIYCRECAAWLKRNPQNPYEDFPPGQRRCTQCLEMKPLDDFHKSPKGRFGRKSVCIPCRSRAQPTPEGPEIPPGMQQCANCGKLKPATPEFFKSASRRATGIGTQCRECATEYSKTWREKKIEQEPDYIARLYQRHQAENQARARRYYESHKEQHRERQRKWDELNAERLIQTRREYYLRNREQFIEDRRQWRKDNAERYRAYNRRWQEENPEKTGMIAIGRDARRRARKRALPYDFSARDWDYCLQYWQNCCAVCGTAGEIHADHWIALSAPGCPGTVRDNMISLCAHCNQTKWATHPEKWLTEKLGAESAAQKLQAIQAYFEHVRTVKAV